MNGLEIKTILENERVLCIKENILSSKEIEEFLQIIELEITEFWTTLEYNIYWRNH